MLKTAIAYRNDWLEAREQDDTWTVRLANLEARARYLDLALAQLLGNAPEAHRVAARLLAELDDVVGQQAAFFDVERLRPGERSRTSRRDVRAKALVLGLHALALAAITLTAFMLTTWLAVLR
jgi:hypothetical protein